MIYAFPHFERFMAFIVERHRIYERRQSGAPAPWTKDTILAQYRFCNVYRELDRVTMWITRHWRTPRQDHADLWFALVVARLINHPFTLAQLGVPLPWDKKRFIRTLHGRRAEGLKTFGSAYIVSTNGRAQDKAEYLANSVLDPMWHYRENLRPRRNAQTLQNYHETLVECQGMGSFMAAQVVADIKYVAPILRATDWWTFAASGPGSRRGMSYVTGNPIATTWREHEWRHALSELSTLVRPCAKEHGLPRIHAQDLQNCLCEFSKYRRTQLGTGRPKQKFTPYLWRKQSNAGTRI